MLRLIVSLGAIALALGQSGTNYQTGDGQSRTESVDPQGNVKGQYSYVDPNGKTISVKYSAGKNGFQVEGDHIPRGAGSPGPISLQSAPYQVPTGPREFPPYQPSAEDGQYQPTGQDGQYQPTADDGQYRSFNQGPVPQPQYSQQGLFAPSGPTGFGQAASQGQIAQYTQEQAAQLAEAQRAATRQSPNQLQPPRVPAATQYTDSPQYSPAQPQIPQQFTQEQLAELSRNQEVQRQLAELSRSQNGNQQLTEEQLIRLSQQQQQRAGPQQLTQEQIIRLSQQQQASQPQLSEQQISRQQEDRQAQLAQQQQLALLVQQQQAQIAQQRAGQPEYRPQEASQPQLARQQQLLLAQQQSRPQFTQQQLAQLGQQPQFQFTPQQLTELRQSGAAAIPSPTHRFSPTGPSPDQGAYRFGPTQ